ncbi:MAG: SDR family NAD(P)-dependent oxidoreductase, partial [Candidatus Competibacteraceae bacterium]|nr:SDR family NAD(P)-dependent oxidoreductase [Candidatus Competibacteraceae bacterium]
ALITGGAMGIGAAVAEHLARQGLTVLLGDIDKAAATRTADTFRGQGHAAQAFEIDVSDPASIASCFEHISAAFGRCDVLVNCAGVAKVFPFLEFPLDNWMTTMAVNVT